MLQGHEQNTCNLPGHFELPRGDVIVHVEQALTNARLEIKDSWERWPVFYFLRDFGVRLCSDVQKLAAEIRG